MLRLSICCVDGGGHAHDGVTDPLEIRPLVRATVARLYADFARIFAEDTIQRFIADSWEWLAGSKVTAFAPLFLERFTRQRLRALARVEGKLTGERPMVVFPGA